MLHAGYNISSPIYSKISDQPILNKNGVSLPLSLFDYNTNILQSNKTNDYLVRHLYIAIYFLLFSLTKYMLQ